MLLFVAVVVVACVYHVFIIMLYLYIYITLLYIFFVIRKSDGSSARLDSLHEGVKESSSQQATVNVL